MTEDLPKSRFQEDYLQGSLGQKRIKFLEDPEVVRKTVNLTRSVRSCLKVSFLCSTANYSELMSSYMSLQIVKDGVELKHLDITPSGTEEQSISQEEAEVYKQVYSLANKKGYKTLNQDWIDLLFGAYNKWALENGKYCPNYQDPDDVCDVGVYDELFDFLIDILHYDEDGDELDVETSWGNLIDWVSEELDGDIETIRSEKKYKSVSWDDIHNLIDFLQQNECEATQKTWTHTVLEEGYDSTNPDQDYFPTQYEVPMFRFHLVRESGLSYAETECPQT